MSYEEAVAWLRGGRHTGSSRRMMSLGISNHERTANMSRMRHEIQYENALLRYARQSYWLGLALGFIAGILAGIVIMGAVT